MKKTLLLTLLLLPILAYAGTDSTNVDQPKILTGYSGGMSLHLGYAFASTPAEMFRNWSLEGKDFIQSLPKDGVTIGLGGQLRLHLFDHMHVGGEGYVSTMPLAGESSIRTGWGGGFVDGYVTAGRIRPLLGLGMGGGKVSRLFVPTSLDDIIHIKDNIAANASFTKTSFFYINPYVGLEILLGPTKSKSLYLKLDYLLPFGSEKGDVADAHKAWSNFITPSGPRLYVGVMFGKQKD